MDTRDYIVACRKCQGERRIRIHETPVGKRIDWLEDKQEKPFTVISARERLDGQWGFQCVCGANDLMTTQERRTFSNPAAPTPQEIDQIVKTLKADAPLFNLVAV